MITNKMNNTTNTYSVSVELNTYNVYLDEYGALTFTLNQRFVGTYFDCIELINNTKMKGTVYKIMKDI